MNKIRELSSSKYTIPVNIEGRPLTDDAYSWRDDEGKEAGRIKPFIGEGTFKFITYHNGYVLLEDVDNGHRYYTGKSGAGKLLELVLTEEIKICKGIMYMHFKIVKRGYKYLLVPIKEEEIYKYSKKEIDKNGNIL